MGRRYRKLSKRLYGQLLHSCCMSVGPLTMRSLVNNSWSGHVLGLWAQFLVGSMWEATINDYLWPLMFLFISLLKKNKNILSHSFRERVASLPPLPHRPTWCFEWPTCSSTTKNRASNWPKEIERIRSSSPNSTQASKAMQKDLLSLESLQLLIPHS